MELHLLHVWPVLLNRSEMLRHCTGHRQEPSTEKRLSIAPFSQRARNKCTKINSGQLYLSEVFRRSLFGMNRPVQWAAAAQFGVKIYSRVCSSSLASAHISIAIHQILCHFMHCSVWIQLILLSNVQLFEAPATANSCGGHFFSTPNDFARRKTWDRKCHRKDCNAFSGKESVVFIDCCCDLPTSYTTLIERKVHKYSSSTQPPPFNSFIDWFSFCLKGINF